MPRLVPRERSCEVNAGQDVRQVRPSFLVASQVGSKLGTNALLQRPLPRRAIDYHGPYVGAGDRHDDPKPVDDGLPERSRAQGGRRRLESSDGADAPGRSSPGGERPTRNPPRRPSRRPELRQRADSTARSSESAGGTEEGIGPRPSVCRQPALTVDDADAVRLLPCTTLR